MQAAVAISPEIAFAQAKWDSLSKSERGAWIWAAMRERKMSKSELADRLGLSFQAIHSWVIGEALPDWSRWMSISLALGLAETWTPADDQIGRARKEIDASRVEPPSPPRKKGR